MLFVLCVYVVLSLLVD